MKRNLFTVLAGWSLRISRPAVKAHGHRDKNLAGALVGTFGLLFV